MDTRPAVLLAKLLRGCSARHKVNPFLAPASLSEDLERAAGWLESLADEVQRLSATQLPPQEQTLPAGSGGASSALPSPSARIVDVVALADTLERSYAHFLEVLHLPAEAALAKASLEQLLWDDKQTLIKALRVSRDYDVLKVSLAEVEGQRKELASKLSHLVDSLKTAEARVLAAEARVAALEKDQTRLIRMVRALLKHTNPFNVNEGHSQQWMAVYDECNRLDREAIAAEQKEAGKC